MTYASSGTQNSVTAAIGGLTQAIANSYVATGPVFSITNYPVSLERGLNESFWADNGLINQMNIVLNQAALAYRI